MSSFIRIVRNYENICRLGHNIINHKDLVRRCPPEKLAEEFKNTGIKINTLALGAVQTEMLEEAFPGYKASINPIEMADFIYKFSLEGNSFFNGKIIPVSITNP